MYRKKPKKPKRSRVSGSSDFEKDCDYQTLKKLYTRIKKKYKVYPLEIISQLEKKEILIPSCIFNRKLSVFESIVKYLKEDLALANKEIARLTSKSQKSIWQSYNSAKKKFTSSFKMAASEYYIPVSALQPPFTIFESVVKFLKEELRLTFHKIATVLNRDDRTIWTVYRRTNEKSQKRTNE